MKVIIAGTRTFDDYELLKRMIRFYFQNNPITEIVSGTANGADKLGERYAKENNIPAKLFPADWKQHGKSAGPIRNEQMAMYAEAAVILWNGKSAGSKSMIDLAKKYKLDIRVVNYTKKITALC